MYNNPKWYILYICICDIYTYDRYYFHSHFALKEPETQRGW